MERWTRVPLLWRKKDEASEGTACVLVRGNLKPNLSDLWEASRKGGPTYRSLNRGRPFRRSSARVAPTKDPTMFDGAGNADTGGMRAATSASARARRPAGLCSCGRVVSAQTSSAEKAVRYRDGTRQQPEAPR